MAINSYLAWFEQEMPNFRDFVTCFRVKLVQVFTLGRRPFWRKEDQAPDQNFGRAELRTIAQV